MPIIVHFLKTHILNYSSDLISVSNVKNDILKINNLPELKLCINLNGKFLTDTYELDNSATSIIRATIAGGLKGLIK